MHAQRTFDLLLINRFAIVSTGWKTRSSATPRVQLARHILAAEALQADAPEAPEPRIRAVAESLPLTFIWGAMLRIREQKTEEQQRRRRRSPARTGRKGCTAQRVNARSTSFASLQTGRHREQTRHNIFPASRPGLPAQVLARTRGLYHANTSKNTQRKRKRHRFVRTRARHTS